LALAGNPVVFVEQPAGVEELRRRGLRLDLTVAHRSVFNIQGSPVSFASSLEEALKTGPFDIAIFALKSFDTSSALEGMKAFANELPPILCLSNGVDNEPAIESALGPGSVIAGVATYLAGDELNGCFLQRKMEAVGHRLLDHQPGAWNHSCGCLADILPPDGQGLHCRPNAAKYRTNNSDLAPLPYTYTHAIQNHNQDIHTHPNPNIHWHLHRNDDSYPILGGTRHDR
jgi:ketopantoate reductase